MLSCPISRPRGICCIHPVYSFLGLFGQPFSMNSSCLSKKKKNLFVLCSLTVDSCLQVRVNALLSLSDLVSTLDKHAILYVLQTVQCCTAVDLLH